MSKGTTPSTSRSGSDVTVQWTAAKLGSGPAVAGYLVRRYNTTTGTPATVGSGCSGVVTSTSCTETTVASGTWVYTDTPVQVNWTGSESANSAAVTVP